MPPPSRGVRGVWSLAASLGILLATGCTNALPAALLQTLTKSSAKLGALSPMNGRKGVIFNRTWWLPLFSDNGARLKPECSSSPFITSQRALTWTSPGGATSS